MTKISRSLIRKLCGLPTNAMLRRKIYELRASSVVASRIQELNTASLGLVLSGGGAKGAYEIGCLRALDRFKIHNLAAVSGTSVGALNGVLIGQGDLRYARQIWFDISFRKVLTARILEVLFAILLRIFVAPVLLSRYWPNSMEEVSLYGSLRQKGVGRIKSLVKTIELNVIPKMIYPIALGVVLSPIFGQQVTFWKLAEEIGLIFGFFAIYVALWWPLSRIHDQIAQRWSLFSNEPLKDLLRTSLSPSRIRSAGVKIFTTVSKSKWVLKLPKRPGLISLDGQPARYGKEPQYEMRFVPEYTNLLQIPDEQIGNYVLQSAALPEVFIRTRIGSVPVLDGGLADNTPILPLLMEDTISHLLVIYLREEKNKSWLLKKERYRIRHLVMDLTLRSEKLTQHQAEELVEKARCQSIEEDLIRGFGTVSKKVLFIVPSRSLGGFLTGTLNFTATKARRLMYMGYWDTLRALERDFQKFSLYEDNISPC